MSKYTEQELQEMAVVTIRAMDTGDLRAKQLLMMLSLVTNVAPEECIARIKAMAQGNAEVRAA